MERIVTYTGEDFYPLAPQAAQIIMEDIAHALSLVCRANGHFRHFYSVAQHCLNCAEEARARNGSPRLQLACLLHDASEAYLSDLTKPVKKYLDNYVAAENRLQALIFEKFLGGPLTPAEHDQVKAIDVDILAHEFEALMKAKVFEVPEICSRPSLECRDFLEVETAFLRLYEKLKGDVC